MSKKKKSSGDKVTPQNQGNRPVASQSTVQAFLFGRENYLLLGGGVLLIIIGFLLMKGGAQPPNQFNTDQIYSFKTVTLSDLFVIGGFVVILFSVLRKRKD